MQQEQRPAGARINMSLAIVIIKQERLTRQLNSFLKLVQKAISSVRISGIFLVIVTCRKVTKPEPG